MKILYKPRQSGKTNELIKLSSQTGYPIICKDRNTAVSIKKRSEYMGYNLKNDPIPIMDIVNSSGYKNFKKVLVDDIDVVMNTIMINKCGAEFVVGTLVERNILDHEIDTKGNDINALYGIDDKYKIEPKPTSMTSEEAIELLSSNNKEISKELYGGRKDD